MRRTEALQGVRMSMFLNILHRWESAELNQEEAAELLGVLAGIATMGAANVHLRDVYIRAHNVRFAVKAEQEGTAFVAIAGVDLEEILCLQEDRIVGNDNTVSYNRLKLQIPESPLRAHFVKANVKVREYPDGTLAVFHGPRCLGRYDEKGRLPEERAPAPRSRQAMVVDGRPLVKAGLRPPPPAASALTRGRPSTSRSAERSKGGSGPRTKLTPQAKPL